MATKKIIEVDLVESLSNDDAIFVNSDNSLKQILKSNLIDNSLTESGKAADAKATGDAISKLSEEIENKAGNVYIGPTQPTDGTLYWLDTSGSGASEDDEETVAYAVTANLTNVNIDNTAESVTDGASFAATLTAVDGYTLSSVTITMGGNDITASAYASGNIYIASVTGDVVITAAAVEVSEEVNTYTITNNLVNVTSNNSTVSIEESSAYTATMTAADGYTLDGATVTVIMGGTDVTADVYADGVITIASVTGDVIITVSAIKESEFTVDVPLIDKGGNVTVYSDAGETVVINNSNRGVLYSEEVFSVDTEVEITVEMSSTMYTGIYKSSYDPDALKGYYAEKFSYTTTYPTGGETYVENYVVKAGYRLGVITGSNHSMHTTVVKKKG